MIGRIQYVRRHGMSAHQGAASRLGLRGLGLF
ncbi:hypothetical protein MPNT_310002 [Candidatus Methylacidithermus pantelleriae]|uniref:Uncharacterized protein n=1 Tax=Candidatus Methylacidithermus pantelleriae TaxID=2744239 RepID=A0A8J2BTR1_9BACT|nr:hypothetical protein MPNT_310002 [Candidatus Methylacidithermus pantelleriae]